MSQAAQNTVKLAIAQLNPTVGDLEGNGQQIILAAQQAQQQGAEVLITPELGLCGYPPRDLLLRPSFITAMGQCLQRLATQMPPQIAVLVGFAAPNPKAHQQGQKPLFNSAALLQAGRVSQVVHKQLLPTYDVFEEDRYFAPGPDPKPVTIALAGGRQLRLGLTICEDLWNDEEF